MMDFSASPARTGLLLLSGVLLVTIAGCSGGAADAPELGNVTGVVTLDGAPAPDLSVTFESESGQASFGKTDSAGKYELYFRDGAKGAALGKNRVIIETTLDAPSPPGYKDPIPPKYNQNTTLSVDVVEGDNQHDFPLESK